MYGSIICAVVSLLGMRGLSVKGRGRGWCCGNGQDGGKGVKCDVLVVEACLSLDTADGVEDVETEGRWDYS